MISLDVFWKLLLKLRFPGTVQEKAHMSDFVPLWDATQGVVHLQNASFCRAHTSEFRHIGLVQIIIL